MLAQYLMDQKSGVALLPFVNFIFTVLDFYLMFTERGREGERKGGKH